MLIELLVLKRPVLIEVKRIVFKVHVDGKLLKLAFVSLVLHLVEELIHVWSSGSMQVSLLNT